MATTENTFTGDGSLNNFPFTFPIIKRDDVKVSLNDTLIASTEYTFTNDTTIVFDAIDPATDLQETSGAPKSDVNVRVFRQTDVDDPVATFFAGSAIRAQDLNENFLQVTYRSQEDENNNWNTNTETIKSDETWDSSDTKIATTAAMDARFQDEAAETILSSEVWPDNDTTIATTAAIDDRIDNAITNDIAGSDGVSITDDGDGTITVGLSAGSVDLDRIKDSDIVTLAEQNAGPATNDASIFTTNAAARRFDTLVQTGTPSGDNWETGKTWLQNDDDTTLSIWNGSSWTAVTSGGTFNNQPKVIYVDASAGNDNNTGHRISNPKLTIKDAIADINADDDGDGCIVVVAPGVYQEAAPIQIQKKDVSIIGQSVRSVVVHPTQATETNTLFELNSGSYISSFTIMGMKASGTRGAAVSDDALPDNPDGAVFGGTATANQTEFGLPPVQGWNFAFFDNATILKSPYVHNVVNFSDSEIDNTADPFPAFSPAGGSAGDVDHAVTGGGMLIDGSVPHEDSPLRSMVADSYTHTALDGPGIFVTNNGYAQLTSSYAFFCHYHIKCLNGGQANLAASTSDFGRFGLIAEGRSTAAIFTSNIDGAVSDGDTTFDINQPTAGAAWFGTANRPSSNMVVDVGGNTYPVRSAVAHTDSEGNAGWTVTIWRSTSDDFSNNLGVDGAIDDNAAVSFFLRSMIASSGHTMEYVGAGCDYRALPYNASGTFTVGDGTADCGVPVEAREVNEIGDGKIWTAITNHEGTFRIGGATVDGSATEAFLRVDQTTGAVSLLDGSYSANIVTDTTPQLGGQLDVNGQSIGNGTEELLSFVETASAVNELTITNAATTNGPTLSATGGDDNVDLNLTPKGTGVVNVTANALTVSSGDITSASNANIDIDPNGTGTITFGANITSNTTFDADVTLAAGHNLIFTDDSASNTFTLQVPDNVTANTTFTLPAAGPTSADELHLKASGTGDDVVLEWAEGGGGGGATGGGSDAIFWQNGQTVTEDHSIPASTNAGSFGPITIDDGVTVTIPSTSNWTII